MGGLHDLAERVRVLQPLRNRDFRVLWTGTTVSLVGDGFFLVALAWQVYDLDASPGAFATVGLAWTLPQVLLLVPAGVLADRTERRHLMIAGDLLRAAAVGSMAALSLSGHISVALMVGLAVIFGIGDAVFIPSFTSIVPALVPAEELVQANSLAEFVRPITQTLLGPFLGGIVIGAAGVGWAFAVDAATFCFSALMIAAMAHRHIKAEEASSPIEDLRQGLAFVRRTRWFWINLVSTSLSLLCIAGAWEVLIPFLVKEDLQASAFSLGLVYAAGGVGGIAAAFTFGQSGRLPKRPLTAYYVIWVVGNLGMMTFGVVYHVWQVVLIAVFDQAIATMVNILWFTMEYRLVPEELLGRVSSLDWMIVLAGFPLSFALVGPLAEVFGVRHTFIVTGAVGAVVMLIPLFIRDALTPERDGSFERSAAGVEATAS